MRQLLAALFVLVILVPLFWFLKMSSISIVLFIGVTLIPILLFAKCYFYRYIKKHNNRSLSFGFKSMRAQKEEFRFINRLKFLPIRLRIFYKKISVFHDPLFDYKKDSTDYFGDPAYSASILNIYHRHKNF